MTVLELQHRITARELVEWSAYEQHAGPLGGARGDQQAAVIAATIANVNRGKNKRPRKHSDFVLQWGGRPEQSWQDQLAIAKQLNSALGGTVASKEG